MFNLTSISGLWRLRRGRCAPAHWRTPWRALAALCTALVFALVVATAASHHHKDSLESRACVVCGIHADKLASLPRPPTPSVALLLLPYRITAVTRHVCLYRAPRMLPPGRGPPCLI